MITLRLFDGFEQAAILRGKKPNVNRQVWKTVNTKQISPKDRATVDFSRLEDKDASINQYEIA